MAPAPWLVAASGGAGRLTRQLPWFDAVAASMFSWPICSANSSHTGFIASTHSWRCSGVSSRISTPAAAISSRAC